MLPNFLNLFLKFFCSVKQAGISRWYFPFVFAAVSFAIHFLFYRMFFLLPVLLLLQFSYFIPLSFLHQIFSSIRLQHLHLCWFRASALTLFLHSMNQLSCCISSCLKWQWIWSNHFGSISPNIKRWALPGEWAAIPDFSSHGRFSGEHLPRSAIGWWCASLFFGWVSVWGN